MRICILTMTVAMLLGARAEEDAAALQQAGIDALKESQLEPKLIVTAARCFAKAAALYETQNDEEHAVETNSYLYWCKKKMTLADIEEFSKGLDTGIAERVAAVAKTVEGSEAQTWFDRAETFAAKHDKDHLLIAIRFFEVADRFKGTDQSFAAQDRSLKEQLLAQADIVKANKAPPKAKAPPPEETPAVAAVKPIQRMAAPGGESLKAAEKQVADVFKADYAKLSAAEKQELGRKLWEEAQSPENEGAVKYVLLRDALNFASQTNETFVALHAADEMGKFFEVDVLALKADALSRLSASPPTAEAGKMAAQAYFELCENCIGAEKFDLAAKVQTAALDVAKRIQNAPLQAQIQALVKVAHDAQSEFTRFKLAEKSLETKPADPTALATVGRYQCLMRDNWSTGLPQLSKSADGPLKTLALKELANPAEPAGQIAVGDGWFEFAGKVELPRMQANLRAHAANWYDKAMPAASGMEKAKLEKRLDAIHATDLRVYRGPPLPIFDNFETTAKGIAKGTWAADKGWCNTGVLNMVANPDEKGTLAQLICSPGTKDKTALTRTGPVNLTGVNGLVFDIDSTFKRDVNAAVLFVMVDGKGYETRPVAVHPGMNRDLRFALDKRDFKSSVSKQPWQAFDTLFEPRNKVQRFSILIYNLTEQGNIEIGPLRMQK